MNVSATAGGRAQSPVLFIGACSLEAARMHMCLPHVPVTYIRYIYHILVSSTCRGYMYRVHVEDTDCFI